MALSRWDLGVVGAGGAEPPKEVAGFTLAIPGQDIQPVHGSSLSSCLATDVEMLPPSN